MWITKKQQHQCDQIRCAFSSRQTCNHMTEYL